MAEYPDLDIYAPPGTKVRAVYLDGKPYHGGKYDHETVVKHLKEGEVYTIANMDVGGWSTSVELVEFPGLAHSLTDAAARTRLLSESDAFLRKSLGLPAN